jgi:hypothetical protein
VRDIQIQPDFDDLLIATHGRSFWILDDLAALQGLTAAQAAGSPTFFRVRDAYMFYTFAGQNESGGSSAFQGTDPDYGALLTYYQASASSGAPSVQIIGPGGRVVRTFSGTHDSDGKQVSNVPNAAGVNRIAWDLTSDAPVKWNSAPKWNRGPSQGPYVVPGTYEARLTLAGRTYSQSVVVKADPRAPWTHQELVANRAFAVTLYDDFSTVDSDLNALDSIEKQLTERRAAAASNAGLVARIDTVRASLDNLHKALSSNPQGDQDNDFITDNLRERQQSLMGLISFAPPTAAQLSELSVLHQLFLSTDQSYRSFIASDVAGLNGALSGAHLAPIKP